MCEDTIKAAEKLAKMLPKSNVSADTLVYVATANYQDSLPLYRLSTGSELHCDETTVQVLQELDKAV